MIVGPFWCEQDRIWVRFQFAGERAFAEVARPSEQNPSITDA
jgi:hypothetical protein